MTTTLKSAFLYFTQGNSDKVYNVHLISKEAGSYDVVAENGRRGSALRQSVKNKAPLNLAAAEKLFDSTVSGKTRKGYTEDVSGVAYSGTCSAERVTGFKPMLLNPVAEADIPSLFQLAPKWALQIKFDGERRGLQFDMTTVTASNRRGLEVPVGQKLADAVSFLRSQGVTEAILDGELMGETLVVFDVLSINGKDLKAKCFGERMNELYALDGLLRHEKRGIEICQTWIVSSPAEVNEHICIHRERGEEGVVLRDPRALYQESRPNTGGPALKVKNWASATVRVSEGRENKRSVGIEMQDGVDGPWVCVGNVTIPENTSLPKVGDLLEVRYLYAYRNGSLFQPTLIGSRSDVTDDACQLGTLVYKREQQAA